MSATGSTSRPLIPMSGESTAFHEHGIMFRFLACQWAVNGAREWVAEDYFRLGRNRGVKPAPTRRCQGVLKQ
jgi:hypothetical protein